MFFKNPDIDFSQGYGQIKQIFGCLTKDDILQPYISDQKYRSSNDGDDVGYDLFVFSMQYQKKNLAADQKITVEFNYSEDVLASVNGYTLVITSTLVFY